MKFECAEKLEPKSLVNIGDVYPAKGGCGKTNAFVVVAVNERMAHALGIDRDGNILTTTSYGIHVFERRERMGFVPDLESFTLTIEPV